MRWKFVIIALAVCVASIAQAEDLFFDSEGVQIRYTVQGEGAPVVLIHGVTVNQDIQWRAPGIIDALAQDFRVIAIDNRGHGKSGKPHGAEHYGAEMAHDVARLLDHMGIEKAHVVGYSLGGFITLKFVTLYPERVLSAVPSGAGWTPPDDARMQLSESIAQSIERGEGLAPLLEFLTPAGEPLPTAEEMAQMNRILAAMNDMDALASVFRGIKGLSVTEEALRANTVPVLAVIGANDPLKETVDAMDGVMGNLTIAVIPDTDHMDAFAGPAYVKIVRNFLAQHSPASELDPSRTD